MTTEFNALDPILKGRPADPAIREGISLVEYPEYLIAETLDGDGLRKAHGRIGEGNFTPEAAARAITDMIVEHLADDIPEDDDDIQEQRPKRKPAFIPHFPKPVIGKLSGKRSPAPTSETPVFVENPAPINFESPITASLLMRTEAVTQLWRQGKIETPRAAHLIEVAVLKYRKREQKR